MLGCVGYALGCGGYTLSCGGYTHAIINWQSCDFEILKGSKDIDIYDNFAIYHYIILTYYDNGLTIRTMFSRNCELHLL